MPAEVWDLINLVRRNRKRFLLHLVLVFLVSCTPAARQLFFDIPPPDPEEESSIEPTSNSVDTAIDPRNFQPRTGNGEAAVERPEIESATSWEEALSQLPVHELGGVDWPAAIAQGIIRPRPGLEPDSALARSFKLDFYLRGPAPSFDAFFPHSSHTQWLGCGNCHPAPYRYKDNEHKMADLYAGKSCGSCHGKVAFPVTQCKRCHTDM